MKKGLFWGLTTIDLIYLVNNFPGMNEKAVALNSTTSVGGPATNAAITFSALGGNATLVSAIGKSMWGKFATSELKKRTVKHIELGNEYTEIPQSSIIVSKNTGERSVVSVNTNQMEVYKFPYVNSWEEIGVLLIDGHNMDSVLKLLKNGKKLNCKIVLDGGSWKEGTEKLLPFIDYAICSADFYPPKCKTTANVLDYLSEFGIENIAVTNGENPITFRTMNREGSLPVRNCKVVDTLGAGDVFHGAFCFYITETENFEDALTKASETATFSCAYFGTHTWIEHQV